MMRIVNVVSSMDSSRQDERKPHQFMAKLDVRASWSSYDGMLVPMPGMRSSSLGS
jgi:hypothetical protein